MNMLTQYLASLLEVIFLRGGLQKYSFQKSISLRKRTHAKSLETCKSFQADFTLYFASSNKRILLASSLERLLAKIAQCLIGLFAIAQEFVYAKRPKLWYAAGCKFELSRSICVLSSTNTNKLRCLRSS